MRRAVVQNLGSLVSSRLGEDPYDQDELSLAPLMVQRSGTGEENWAGPLETKPFLVGQVTAGLQAFPWAMQWGDKPGFEIDWIFMADQSTAAATRRIYMYTYNRETGNFSYIGNVLLTFPTATNHTIRALRMTYDKYSVGTVAVSGTAVTGTSTLWTTDRMAVGCRIGFGSTDPTQISTWYDITAIGSETGITIGSTAGTITAGTAYVIEDLRCITATTNATATNGGLYLAKGLSYNAFAAVTTIPAATTVDNIRAVYWLKDAATVLNTVASGMANEPRVDWQNDTIWVTNGTTTQRLFKHNLRAALTLASGAATNQFILASGTSATLTGTMTSLNNGRYAVADTGTGAGVPCLYFTTSTRIYRTKDLSTISSGDTTFLTSGDNQVPQWPGGNANFAGAAPAGLQSIEYAGSLDLFVIPNLGTNLNKVLLSSYRADGSAMDRVMLSQENLQYIATSAAEAATGVLEPTAISSVWAENGLLYANWASATTGGLYVIPIGADWEFQAATRAQIVLPKIDLTDASNFRQICVQSSEIIGNTSGNNLGIAANPFKVKYRTSGISDNSGTWTYLDQTGNFNAAGTASIQIGIEFRTIGLTAQSARIHSVTLVYDDTNTDDHYQFSVNESSAASKQFAWRHATAFGGSVPPLRIRLFDAVTGSSLVDDNTSSPTGTFERSTDGTSYSGWTNADKSTDTTYVRYTPASIADSIQVRAVLTLL